MALQHGKHTFPVSSGFFVPVTGSAQIRRIGQYKKIAAARRRQLRLGITRMAYIDRRLLRRTFMLKDILEFLFVILREKYCMTRREKK